MSKSKIEEKKIDLAPYEGFFEKIGMPLTAFSVFLTVLFEVLKPEYLKSDNPVVPIFLAVLFGLIISIGIYILYVSQEFNRNIITLIGLAVAALPFLYYNILSPDITNKVSGGGYILILFLSGGMGFILIDKIFLRVEKKIKSKLHLYLPAIGVSAVLFLILKYTTWLAPYWRFLIEDNPTWYFQSFLLGIKFGIVLGIITVPLIHLMNKIHFKIK